MRLISALVLIAEIAFAHSVNVVTREGAFTPPVLAEAESVAVGRYRFNPAVRVPELPANLRGESNYYLVHLQGPVRDEMTRALKNRGAEIIDYVPFNTFLCRIQPEAKSAVADLPFVTWLGNYEPAYKLSPLWQENRGNDTLRPGHQKTESAVIILFPDADAEAVALQLQALGAEIQEVSVTEYNRMIRAELAHEFLATVAQLPEVKYIEPWLEPTLFNENAQWVTQTWRQGVRRIWLKGVNGSTQTVNTADTGILVGATTHDMFRDPAVAVTTWGDFPTHRKIIGYRTWTGSSAAFGDVAAGDWHGSHTAGTICGDDSYVNGTNASDGMAIKAKMYHMDIGTSSGTLSVPSDLTNLYTLPFNGNAGGAARVSSHSWGSTSGFGTYPAYSATTDQFMWNHKDFLIVYAAGNSGPGATTVSPPGTAKNIVTCGATANGTSANQIADFSSRGPCNDTRYKPTVTAPGQQVFSAIGPSANTYGYMQGTSMATPNIAGNAALIRDYFAKGFYPTGESVPLNRWNYISAALVKACLVNCAAPDMLGLSIPDNNTGWGRILLDDALYFVGDVRKTLVVDDTVGITTGALREYTVPVNNQSEPLKITLVWTDYPGTSGANPAIVNNLDLEVVGPNSTTYRGNQYTSGQSAPNPASWDNRNVEENVRRNTPELGNWVIRVKGTNVPRSPQPFALVVTGGLGELSEPTLHIASSHISDPAPGNGNGKLDPGETVTLVDTLKNLSGTTADAVIGTLRKLRPNNYVTLLDSVADFGTIPMGASGANTTSPFRISADGATPPGTIAELVLNLQGTNFSQSIPFELMVGVSGFSVIWGPKPLPSFPSTGFNYGLAYCPLDENLYVMSSWSRRIYIYTSDSSLQYVGSIPSPDTCGTDIKWCDYDNTFWVAANYNAGGRKIYKLSYNGTKLRQFNSPAVDYPTGLAWVEAERRLYAADRRTNANTFPQYVYTCDTLGGNSARMDVPLQANYGPRGLAFDPNGVEGGTLLMVYTSFNSGGTGVDSVGVYEFRRSNLSLVQRQLLPGWNARGIEYDPRDGTYWISIPQGPARTIAKIAGFNTISAVQDQTGRQPVLSLSLQPARPNPFRGTVKISYQLPAPTRVKLTICDLTGRTVAVLANGIQPAGLKDITWNGHDKLGLTVGSGVYFCRLETPERSLVTRIVSLGE